MQKVLILSVLAASSALAQNDRPAGEGIEAAPSRELPEVTIIGHPEDVLDIAGSAAVVTGADILEFNQSDIQRVVRRVPGVSVQVEDGYGLRPNLSIRGTASERSARITLLEDGVLIAPAPYAAPAAYYFPTTGRMSGIEVLKGPAAITEGPYTVGGAINMLSTPIPSSPSGLVNLQLGQDATWRVHAHYGKDDGRFGWLVETHQWESDGFQDIDGGGDTGLDKEDYTLKLRYSTDESARLYQQLDFKYQYANEGSEQSYLGLTDADFSAAPLRRYGLSRLDRIDTEHNQFMLSHLARLDDLSVNTTLYYNDHKRDWFKTEGLDVDGSEDAGSFDRTSWFNVIQAVNRGEGIGALGATDLQAILQGGDTAAGSIQLRSNAREYYSRGIQIDAHWLTSLAATDHEITFGAKRHFDHAERLQRNSTYSQSDGDLVLDDPGLLGNAGNREQDADVWAFWLRDEISLGALTLSPGLRYEIIDQDRVRYEIRNGLTDNPADRSEDNVRDRRDNQTNVLIPGLGFVYDIGNAWSVYGGVHKGFSAPTNATDVDEEKSVNYELGMRRGSDDLYLDAALFLTDYDNLLGTCTSSSGADCEIGDAFNGDAATVQGLELQVARVFRADAQVQFPVELSYTYIDAQFDSDIADTDFFGDVSKGDPLPYIPDNQALLTAGAEAARWATYLSLNFVDGTCVRGGCGAFEKTDSSVIFDASARWRYSDALTLTATVENLTGAEDISARTPYGARPNKDRTFMIGAQLGL